MIAADPVELAAVIVYQSNKETNLSRRVQGGECGPHECDPYRCKDDKTQTCHAARGLGQHHRKQAWSDSYWANMSGLGQDSVDQQMWELTKTLIAGKTICKTWDGAFANAASGHGCKWSGGATRAAGMRAIEKRIRKLMATEAKEQA